MPVMIGVDPHKASHTAAALDEHGRLLDRQRIAASLDGYRLLRQWAVRWPDRCWAVEGAHGIGRALAQRLVGDGEQVLDVPAKLVARVRVLSVGHGRKSDPDDAVSVAVAARNARGLRQVRVEDQAVMLHLLTKRRQDLVAARTQTINRLHRLLMDLIPGLSPQDRACNLRERPTAGDRCEPLGSDGMWTKRGPALNRCLVGKARMSRAGFLAGTRCLTLGFGRRPGVVDAGRCLAVRTALCTNDKSRPAADEQRRMLGRRPGAVTCAAASGCFSWLLPTRWPCSVSLFPLLRMGRAAASSLPWPRPARS
jgi:Transposase